MRSYLILHGLGGSLGNHWQNWLAKELQARGHKVFFPQMPDWDHPVKAVWLNCLQKVMDQIPEDESLTVVTHSLGCALWFHYTSEYLKRPVNRAILVSPPSPFLDIPEIQDFFPLPKNQYAVAETAQKAILIFSSDDPYLPQKDATFYFNYNLPCLVLAGKGHVNPKTGFGPWPWMLQLCENDSLAFPEMKPDANPVSLEKRD